jgi:hypothetical protein
MRIVLFLFFYALSYSILYSQTDSSFYFPTKSGNLWQYKEPPPPVDPYITEIRTSRDTTFSNGQTYRIFLADTYGYPDTSTEVYRRQIDNRVYKYYPNQQKEFLVYDFLKNIGDTVSIFPNPMGSAGDTSIVTVLDAGIQNIFGKSRRYMTFYNRTIHGSLYWIDRITDSIGITFSQIEPGLQFYLVGAIVDSVRYGTVTGVSPTAKEIPNTFILYQNFPNPFNPSTTIYVRVSKGESFTLFIYNVLGERIRALYAGRGNGDTQSIIWDGKNDAGIRVSSGVYFYQIRAVSSVAIKKMLLIQ